MSPASCAPPCDPRIPKALAQEAQAEVAQAGQDLVQGLNQQQQSQEQQQQAQNFKRQATSQDQGARLAEREVEEAKKSADQAEIQANQAQQEANQDEAEASAKLSQAAVKKMEAEQLQGQAENLLSREDEESLQAGLYLLNRVDSLQGQAGQLTQEAEQLQTQVRRSRMLESELRPLAQSARQRGAEQQQQADQCRSEAQLGWQMSGKASQRATQQAIAGQGQLALAELNLDEAKKDQHLAQALG